MILRSLVKQALSKPGSLLGFAFLIGCFLAISGYVIRQNDDFVRQRTTFLGLNMREGFVALSDLQRINLIVLEAIRSGAMNGDQATRLDRATDFLFVRANSFHKSLAAQPGSAGADSVLGLIDDVIVLLDAAKADDYGDIHALSHDLISLTDEIRRLLFVFLDDQRRAQQFLVASQSDQLRSQTLFLTGTLFFLTLVAATALLLLMHESRLRRSIVEAESRAQYLAYYDSLTGLPNRAQFQDRVLQELENNRPLSIFFVDLDNFKGINDSQGHAAGDEVLRFVARQLATQVDAFEGYAARIAGDEFALCVPETDEGRLTLLADAIMESMQETVEFEGESLDVGLSLGIAPSDRVVESLPLEFESLCRIADFCLYASKTSGRNQYTIFDSELNERFVARRAILTELSEAMKWGEIEAWFQPKVSLESEAVFGFEALCRWNRGGTLVPPDEFIPVAEASGSIIELDLYMMREACRIVSTWNQSVGTEYSVSVNLSATHFRSGSIVESVARVLRDTKLAPKLLTLEITETVQLVNWDIVRDIFAQLRKLGCRISIDDFGSGYSSLAYLRAMQADELKIDRSLVQEIETSDEARHVLSSVIELAHSLNMRVIVEGVESEDQSDILSSLGCVYGQGYLFGKPMPAKSALARYAASVGFDIAS